MFNTLIKHGFLTNQSVRRVLSNLYYKMSYYLSLHPLVDHSTVVCVVAWPLNESEARVELFL